MSSLFHQAKILRDVLKVKGTVVVHLYSFYPSGKTDLILNTVRSFKNRYNIGAITIGLNKDRETQKYNDHGVKTLNAIPSEGNIMTPSMLQSGIDNLRIDDLDLLFIEHTMRRITPFPPCFGQHYNVFMDLGMLRPPKALIRADLRVLNYHFTPLELVPRFSLSNYPVRTMFLTRINSQGIVPWLHWLENRLSDQKKQTRVQNKDTIED